MSQFYSVFDVLQDLVLVVDRDWNLHYGNNAASLLFEVTPKRLKSGKPLEQWLVFKQPVLDESTGFPLEEPSKYREVEFTSPTGKEGWVQVSLVPDPCLVETGKMQTEEARWVLFMRDVSLEKILHKKYMGELDQKEAVINDLRAAREQLEDYSKNLEKMVAARTAELNEANRLMAAILNSLSQGILVFDREGQTLPFSSRVCESIFGKKPQGLGVPEVLNFNPKETSDFKTWCGAVFEEMLEFQDMVGLGPSKFAHSEGRHISLGFNPMRSESGQLTGVVMVATDRTDEVLARQEAERERAFAKMVISIVKYKSQFRSFALDSRILFASLLKVLKETSPQKAAGLDFDEMARGLHTVKGGAATFGLADLVHILHHAEQLLIEFKEQNQPGVERDFSKPEVTAEQFLTAMLTEVEKGHHSFEGFLGSNSDLFGGALENRERMVEVAVSSLLAWRERMGIAGDIPKLQSEILSNYIQVPVAKSFQHIDAALVELGERLGKQVHPVELHGGDLKVVPEIYDDLFGTFIHAFRNAMDHGMESTEKRIESGKDPKGKIKMYFQKQSQADRMWLEVRIQDDGGGIDPEKIRARLKEMGRWNDRLHLPDHEIIQAVFSDDFSTKTVVTDISGRGVGLPAIKERAEKMGGQAIAESIVGKGCTFVVRVPWFDSVGDAAKASSQRVVSQPRAA